MTKQTRSEYAASEAMQAGLKPRAIPAWQVPSTCKRRARGISIAKRIARMLGL